VCARARVSVYVRACMRVRARVCARVCECVRVCVCVCVSVCLWCLLSWDLNQQGRGWGTPTGAMGEAHAKN